LNPATRQRLRLSGGTELSFISAREASKLAVLLLHGPPSSARMFRDFIPELSQAAHVIAPDLPGLWRVRRAAVEREFGAEPYWLS
jgi:pimeloyl-ACP methyl ester carboxylesterase